ncbi:hypothetical protein [Streptomyces sp. NPDC006355]|uniref:hypothetical protein n=1 Tax=Streptomyces sp. NPDC006355 TaxID=3156758 RepID=UPI0033BBA73F
MFEQGDRVLFEGKESAEVQFGPFRGPGGTDSYLVKWSEGHMGGLSSIVRAATLEAAPKFEADEIVRSEKGLLLRVVSGPYTWSHGVRFYVVEKPDGPHTVIDEDDMTPVEE